MLGDRASRNAAAYVASKGTVHMLTCALCAEWTGRGMQVNALPPGYIETDLTRALVDNPEFTAGVRGRAPAGRWGRMEDLVGAGVFLAAPGSDFVNGQILVMKKAGILAVI
jgi:gluconate 5-dehydrogenase